MSRKCKHWSKDEIELLKQNYPTKGFKYCFNKLQRTKEGIKFMIKKLKLKLDKGYTINKVPIDVPDGFQYCFDCKINKEISAFRNNKIRSCKECYTIQRHKTYYKRRFENVESIILQQTKTRAKSNNITFNLTIEDIIIPKICPVLGIEIKPFDDSGNSPSIDRFVPELGYIKGNVSIISHRANMLKNNATAEELQKIVDWIKVKNQEISSIS